MKKITIIIFLSLLSSISFSQDLEGKFNWNFGFYIYFDNGLAEFNVGTNGGVINPLKGIGKFSISSNYLFIHTSNFNDYKNKYYSKCPIESIIEENRVIVFKIFSIEKNAISLMLLDIDTMPKIYTLKVLEGLEKDAKKYEFQIREFKK